MFFEQRSFQVPKDPEHPEQNQDALAVNPQRGTAAVADGVASAIFSRRWAELIAQAAVADPWQPTGDGFAGWLSELRREWSDSIDTSGLAWFQRAKLPTGAFSTLVWAVVGEPDDGHEPPTGVGGAESPPAGPRTFGGYRLRAWAIGDSCLFHIRHGELLRAFPVGNLAEFDQNPMALGSVDLGRDNSLQFEHLDVPCYPDDTILLCSDAVAEWLYRAHEAGDPPDWAHFLELDENAWQQWVDYLRQQRAMRYDDATLLVLRLLERRRAEDETSVADRHTQAAETTGTSESDIAEHTADAPRSAESDSVSGSHSASEDLSRDAQLVDESTEPSSGSSDTIDQPPRPLDQIAEGIDRLTEESVEKGKRFLQELRHRLRRPPK